MRHAGFFFFFLVISATTTAVAQTRTDTKDLGKKVLQEAEHKRREADLLEAKARAAQNAVAVAERKLKQIDGERAEIANQLSEIRRHKAKLLGELVWDIMNDPKIGHLVKAKPERIRMIPVIEEILGANPWINPVLEEILKDYR